MNKNINLLPPELRTKELKNHLDMTKVLLILIGAVVLGGFTLFFSWIKFTEYRINQLTRQLTEIMPDKVKVESFQKENKQLKLEITDLTKIHGGKKKWTPLLMDLNNHLPQDMWITDFSCDQENNFQIQGLAANLATIGVFLYELNQLPYFQELNLQQSKEIKVGNEVLVNYLLVGTLREGSEK